MKGGIISGFSLSSTFNGNKVPEGFELKLTNIEKQYYPDFMKGRNSYLVTPFKGSHLDSSLEGDIVPGINPKYLWILQHMNSY